MKKGDIVDMKSILHYPKNKISLSELQEYYKLQTYAELVSIVEELQDKGQITPIKNSKGNGKSLHFIICIGF